MQATETTLLEVFTDYNQAVWPAHVLAYALGVLAVALVLTRPGRATDRLTSGILAALWLWIGVVFLGMYATELDAGLSLVYAVTFVVQAALLARAGIVRSSLTFDGPPGTTRTSGWLIVGFAMVVYPLLGLTLGHGYPEAPLFGMAPCPTTIATFGLLLVARPPVPHHLFAVPLMWAVLAPPAAIAQGVSEDVSLFLVGITATVVAIRRDRRTRPAGHRPRRRLGARTFGRGPATPG